MSVHISSRVWKQSKQKGSCKLLLIAIADMANDYGHAWPGIDTLRVRLGCQEEPFSERQTIRLIQACEAANELYVHRREGYVNHYIVLTGMTDNQKEEAIEHLASFLKITPDIMSPLTPESVPPDIGVSTPLTPESVDPSLNVIKHQLLSNSHSITTGRRKSQQAIVETPSQDEIAMNSIFAQHVLQVTGSKVLTPTQLEQIQEEVRVFHAGVKKIVTLPSLIEFGKEPQFIAALENAEGFQMAHKSKLSRTDVIKTATRLLDVTNPYNYAHWLDERNLVSPLLEKYIPAAESQAVVAKHQPKKEEEVQIVDLSDL